MAEQAGCESPYAFQYLLGRATWDVNRLRDSICQYTVDFMPQEEGVLSLDETGFLKKGNKSAGVGRQYTGTAGIQQISCPIKDIGMFFHFLV